MRFDIEEIDYTLELCWEGILDRLQSEDHRQDE